MAYEIFKSTGNMKLVLDKGFQMIIFPAVDIVKSGTRRDDLLLSQSELEANRLVRNTFIKKME